MNRLRDRWQQLGVSARLRVMVIPVLLVGALVPLMVGLARTGNWNEFAVGFGTEMAGSLVTFIMLDLLIGDVEKQEAQVEKRERLKAHLVSQLSSKVNHLATRAAEELRDNEWLEDGSLVGVNLSGANLEGARLSHANLERASLYRVNLCDATLYQANLHRAKLVGADLRGASLFKANLDQVYLQGANLEGACNLTDAQLAQAYRLKGAIMPDGSRYDGRLNLRGDVQAAQKKGIDTGDPFAMARVYGVTVEEYERGQEWARRHLGRLKRSKPFSGKLKSTIE